MGDKFTIELCVNNIGPHYDDKKLVLIDELESNKAVIFAPNGTGKSFISRIFRLTAPEKQSQLADELLTLGQTSGNMTYSIKDRTGEKKLAINITRGKTPTIQNSTDLLFHVFNSDYVEENIKPRHYNPDGNIEGYILGKEQIDLSKERELEESLKEQLSRINNEINNEIDQAKRELKDNGVVPTTKEFSSINRQTLFSDTSYQVAPFDEIIKQLEILSKLPEKVDDIQIPTINIDETVLNEIETILTTEYPKTDWDEEFIINVRSNRAFIEKGVALIGDDTLCPFCRQNLEHDALSLIHAYKEFLNNKEAQILRTIERNSENLKTIVLRLNDSVAQTKSAIIQIEQIKQYFPSLENMRIAIPTIGEKTINCFNAILVMLDDKSANLTKTFPAISDSTRACRNIIGEFQSILSKNAEIIRITNKTKQDSTTERLALRRNLCKAQFSKYQNSLKKTFIHFFQTEECLKDLQGKISQKEQKAKTSKKEKYFDTLSYFLNRFFNEKYTIDKSSFQIKFRGGNLSNNASSVLSDGEKSIVAFCHYLASVHLLVEQESDYNRLFFLIDDPISSMDFHFVYAMAQTLRLIKPQYNITKHDRLWILTHNMEFASIIARNRIINKVYIMSPGHITKSSHQMLLPYECHLMDIVKVASEKAPPSHTTANSIRHVLETVTNFEYPEKRIDSYITENDVLSKNPYIYTLCQDLSHGCIRNQQPFTNEMLVSACKTIVNFMDCKYGGQIAAIKSLEGHHGM